LLRVRICNQNFIIGSYPGVSAIFSDFSANIFEKSGNLPLKIADNSGIRADSKILIADLTSPQLFTSDM